MVREPNDLSRQITNISDLTDIHAEFVQAPEGWTWRNFSGLPKTRLERLVRKPRLSRLRAAWTGVSSAGRSPIISHLPRMTAAVSAAQSIQGNRSRHLAFSFNFTDLPTGADFRRLRRAFERVDQFCVFSEFERQTYPHFFDLPSERFTKLIWTQPPPEVSSADPKIAVKSYVTAIGGEGRDYDTLIETALKLPGIEFIIITRPNVIVRHLPKNVRVLTNLGSDIVWRIALDSTCLIIPLKSDRTCCGHITIVSAEQLGIPVISSRSFATREYTSDIMLYEPGDVGQLTERVYEYHHNWERYTEAASERRPSKIEKYHRKIWENAVSSFVLDT